jgi:hypothetical protein
MKKKMIALALKKKRIASLTYIAGGTPETNIESQCDNAPCTGDTNITGACDSELASCYTKYNTTSKADSLPDSGSIMGC